MRFFIVFLNMNIICFVMTELRISLFFETEVYLNNI